MKRTLRYLEKCSESEVSVDVFKSDLGWVAYAVTTRGLLLVRFMFPAKSSARLNLASHPLLKKYKKKNMGKVVAANWRSVLRKSLSGGNVSLSKLPIDDQKWTLFAKKVYRYVSQIPAGKVKTYGEVAAAVSRPTAARAVGRVMGANPIAPLVPCHRIVGATGKLVGYSAIGGLALKKNLLSSEKVPHPLYI